MGYCCLKEKVGEDTKDAHKFVSRTLTQEYAGAILRQLLNWKDGFFLSLPGQEGVHLLQPRLAVVIADIVQMRDIAAVKSTFSLHFNIRLDYFDGGIREILGAAAKRAACDVETLPITDEVLQEVMLHVNDTLVSVCACM